MRKLRFFKTLFVAAALALVIPGCSGVDSDEGTNIPQTQGNKVALKISAREGYRTALPTVDLSSYTYELTADVMTENTPAGEPTALISALYADLTKANSVYVEADKTYLFVLKATDDSNGEILSGTLTQAINASNNSLSFKLFAIDSASDTGSVSIDVTYAAVYGVGSVVPTLHKMDGTSLAETYPLTYTPADSAGTGRVTGSVPVGKSYVKIVLKDASSTEVGSIPQEAVYAVKGLTSSSAVNIQVKQYKATIALTTSDDSAPTLTLKNQDITTQGYEGISTSGEGSPFTVTKAGDSAPYTYTYTGYVPTAAYDVYKASTKIGTVQNVTPLELNESVTLESIAVAWTAETAPTLYVGTTESDLRAALTVTATLSSGTNTVTDYSLSGFDSTATTAQTVTVSYTYNGVEKKAQIAVTLVEDTISSIAVKTEPTTKTFTVGSELDLTGLVITATYASGKPEDVAYGTDNASQFSVKYYSDEACTTELAVADITAGTVYAKIVYAKKMTDKIAVMVEATIETLTWDFSNATVSMYSDSACTKEGTLEGTAGTAYLKDSSSANAIMKVEIPTGSKIAIDTSNKRVQANAGALFYIPVSNGSEVTVTQKSSVSYELGGKASSLTYKASAAGYVLFEAIVQNYLTKIVVTNVNVAESHATDVVSFVSETNKTTANTEDVLGFVATSVSSADETIATAVISDSAIEIASVAPSTASAARSTTITATGANDELTSWTVSVNRYGKITLGDIEPWTSETLVTATYFSTPADNFTAVGSSSDTDVLTCVDAAATAGTGVYGAVNSVTSHYYEVKGYWSKDDTITTVTLTLKPVKPIKLKSIKGNLNESATGNITRTVKIGTKDAISLGNGKAVSVNVSDIDYNVNAGSTVDIVFTTTATADIGSSGKEKTMKQLFKDIVITAVVEDTASTTLSPTFSLTAVGSSDITLSCSGNMVTATPPAGATVSAYSWIVDNVSVDTNTATLSVGSLAAGIHSIVVEATDSSTGVKYAAQYVLMVN